MIHVTCTGSFDVHSTVDIWHACQFCNSLACEGFLLELPEKSQFCVMKFIMIMKYFHSSTMSELIIDHIWNTFYFYLKNLDLKETTHSYCEVDMDLHVWPMRSSLSFTSRWFFFKNRQTLLRDQLLCYSKSRSSGSGQYVNKPECFKIAQKHRSTIKPDFTAMSLRFGKANHAPHFWDKGIMAHLIV